MSNYSLDFGISNYFHDEGLQHVVYPLSYMNAVSLIGRSSCCKDLQLDQVVKLFVLKNVGGFDVVSILPPKSDILLQHLRKHEISRKKSQYIPSFRYLSREVPHSPRKKRTP